LKSISTIVHDNKYNIGYWTWEIEIFPQHWIRALAVYDEIWCPSAFVKHSVESSSGYYGTPVNVLTIPILQEEAHHSPASRGSLPYEMTRILSFFVALEIEHNQECKGIENEGESFTFLVVSDFQNHKERKNPVAAILAFLEAFPSHSGTAVEMEEMKLEANKDPRVVFITRVVSDAENIALHHHQDCYVSLHRSDGYGLNILVFMGAGIPLIATICSGNVEVFGLGAVIP
jgi:glycosyltransferase involved in cell wall biosynthesis